MLAAPLYAGSGEAPGRGSSGQRPKVDPLVSWREIQASHTLSDVKRLAPGGQRGSDPASFCLY